MTISKMMLAAVAASALLASAAVPASAVSIRHTNRAGGDPDQASVPTNHGAAPPTDTVGARRFDKLHEDGNLR